VRGGAVVRAEGKADRLALVAVADDLLQPGARAHDLRLPAPEGARALADQAGMVERVRDDFQPVVPDQPAKVVVAHVAVASVALPIGHHGEYRGDLPFASEGQGVFLLPLQAVVEGYYKRLAPKGHVLAAQDATELRHADGLVAAIQVARDLSAERGPARNLLVRKDGTFDAHDRLLG